MADHCAVESVFGHYGRPSPALFRLTPLGTPILEPNLSQYGRKVINLKAKLLVGYNTLLWLVIH